MYSYYTHVYYITYCLPTYLTT